MREELRDIRIGVHGLAEALRLQKCGKTWISFISLGWFAPGIKADKILTWTASCGERCGEHKQARSPRRLAVVASPFYKKPKKKKIVSALIKNISTFPVFKRDIIQFFCTDMKTDLVYPFSSRHHWDQRSRYTETKHQRLRESFWRAVLYFERGLKLLGYKYSGLQLAT